MGQAWCKEKSTKAQDSKSPLDRVFLRCAHRIYPGLKEEGSVLGGATQRVTSSEIGYASSPPREVLTRGQSIDSVDRPFHPSDWVDVNLEVPVTPRTSTAMTNLTLDTTIYPPATLTSSGFNGSNLRDFTPVPPPRRKKKNRGRPLPPKPNQVTKSHVDPATIKCSKDSRNSSHEPLYSSVNLPNDWTNDKEVFEHKMNGTGKVIPSIVVAARKSNRGKSSRECEKSGAEMNSRPKNSSTVSLPNYLELEASNDNASGDQDVELKIHKITAAGSLPALITSGALENLKKSDNARKAKEQQAMKLANDDQAQKCSFDEVDFSFDVPKNQNSLNSILESNGPTITSTPVKSHFANDSSSPTTTGGWFLHPDRAPESRDSSAILEKQEAGKTLFYDCQRDSRSDVFFEAEENQSDQSKDNREKQKETERRRRSLKRSLSNESEPFDVCEEKEVREGDSTMAVRSNSEVKLVARTISEESLPEEMLENEVDFFEDKSPIELPEENKKKEVKKVVSAVELMKSDDTKTPPPSPEPKIKPEIFDNDHSSLLKVLRDEAEESNLSSMTPSLTELEAALSDMLDREDDQSLREESLEKLQEENPSGEKSLEQPIEPKIVRVATDDEKSISGVSQSLKTILGASEHLSKVEKSLENIFEDSLMTEIDLTNGNKMEEEKIEKPHAPDVDVDNLPPYTSPAGEPPEKPSRLHHTSHEEPQENPGNIPTPPRRRNRYSGYTPSILDRRSLERTATLEKSHSNDRLI